MRQKSVLSAVRTESSPSSSRHDGGSVSHAIRDSSHKNDRREAGRSKREVRGLPAGWRSHSVPLQHLIDVLCGNALGWKRHGLFGLLAVQVLDSLPQSLGAGGRIEEGSRQLTLL